MTDGLQLGNTPSRGFARQESSPAGHFRERSMPLTSQELQSKLWQVADILRGQINSTDYKNYISTSTAPSRPDPRGLGFSPAHARGDNAGGMVGVVMPHGVLFRGGAEGKIRKGIVDADLFEAIIGLAPNLFFGAAIPVSICVLNKNKPAERRGKVLFVDAAQDGYYRPGKAQNFLEREHVDSIVSAFQGYEDVERFAHVADLEEIAGNDYNLNISQYVDTTETMEVISVEDALAQLREAERRRDEAVARMDELLAGLGYSR